MTVCNFQGFNLEIILNENETPKHLNNTRNRFEKVN